MTINESNIDIWFKGTKEANESRVHKDIRELLSVWSPQSDIR